MKKIGVVLLIGVALALANHFQLTQWLTLEGVKEGVRRLQELNTSSPALVVAVFMTVYVTVTAFSFPGAAVLTLGAGALFGVLEGTLLVSFASTIGATLAFLASRYLLRDFVQSKFSARLKAINDGVEREGGFYLFTLRLVPVVPFFLINLLMGLTRIKIRTFYWVSQLGMLAGTAVYVNAGTQLAKIDSLKGILSPALLLSFILLGLFPLIAKRVLNAFKRRKVYAKWNKPAKFDQNLIVIGAGAAGLVTAYIAAAVKAKVTLIEAHKMGGDCLNYGCVPSKALIKSAKVADTFRHANRYGLEAQAPQFKFKTVMQRILQVIATVEPHDSVERYTGLGVNVVEGYAELIDPWTVKIKHNDGQESTLTARSIVIAAGAAPAVPDLPGLDEVGYLTSDTVWEAFAQRDEAPKRLVVIGGGPIGCELSQSFSRLGIEVTQVQNADRIMLREDPEVSALAQEALENSGVNVLTGHQAVRCELKDGQKNLIVYGEGQEKALPFDDLLCAVGRAPRLTGYGLEKLGIPTNRTVSTNEYLETLYPNIFAAGDIAGPYQFTHVAAHQAWYAAVNALFGHFKKFKVDYRVIPWTTFIDPEVARVGFNETEAREKGIEFDVTRYGIDDLDRAIADGTAHGFVKVLTAPGKDKILGVTIVGSQAGDLLAEFVLAMKHNLGLNKILGTIHAYPTMSEANKYAAGEWKRANAPVKVLNLLGKYHAWRIA